MPICPSIHEMVNLCGPQYCQHNHNGKHSPHPGPCTTFRKWRVHLMNGETIVVPSWLSKQEVKLWVCKELNMPQLLVMIAWDGTDGTALITTSGLEGTTLDSPEWSGDVICACCGDACPSDGYQCSDCGLGECCSPCRQPYLKLPIPSRQKRHTTLEHCTLCIPDGASNLTHRAKAVVGAWQHLDDRDQANLMTTLRSM